MQIVRFIFVIFILLIFTTPNLPADWDSQRRVPESEGWSFYASLSYLYSEQKDSNQSKSIDSYKDSSTGRAGLLVPDIEVQYSTPSLLFGVNLDDLSFSAETSVGSFSFSYGLDWLLHEYGSPADNPEEQEGRDIFQNPYVLNEDRKTTNLRSGNFEFDYQVGEELIFNLAYSEIWTEIAKDLTPSISSSLGRNSTREELELGLSIQIISIRYLNIALNAEGKADSADGTGTGIDIFLPLEELNTYAGINLGWESLKFRKEHPVFGKTREDKSTAYSFLIAYDLAESWDLFLVLAQNKTKSNMAFFDSLAHSAIIGSEIAF